MASIMNYRLFENGVKVISCAYYHTLLWKDEHPPKSYWCFYWNELPENQVCFSGCKVPFGSKHAVLIPPYTSYTVNSETEMPLLYLYFELNQFMENILPELKEIILDPVLVTELCELKEMVIGQEMKVWRFPILFHIVSGILLKLGKSDFDIANQPDQRIMQALEIIHRNYTQKLDNQKICRTIGMSENNFLRLFLRNVGQTPHSYLNYIRIRNARRMLREGNLSIDEIAEKTGFPNRYHFTRIFKKYTFISPAKYRDKKHVPSL